MSQQIRGAETLLEAADLFSQMRVSHQHSGYAVGFYSTVFVRPHYDADCDFSLIVNCQSRMNRRIDWDRLSIAARPISRADVAIRFPVRLDRNGEARLIKISEGEYQLTGLANQATIDEARCLGNLRRGHGAPAVAAAAEVEPSESTPQPPRWEPLPVYLSMDGSLVVRVGSTENRILVEFTSASAANLEGRLVEFGFVSENECWDRGFRIVQFRQERANLPGGESPRWVALWEGDPPPEGLNTLLYTLLPESRSRKA
jgi:hypothetical protein